MKRLEYQFYERFKRLQSDLDLIHFIHDKFFKIASDRTTKTLDGIIRFVFSF